MPLKILRCIERKKILFVHFSSTEELLIDNYLTSKLRPRKIYIMVCQKNHLTIIKKSKNNYIYELCYLQFMEEMLKVKTYMEH